MPLRKKLLLSMLVPALLLVAVDIVGIFSLRHLEQAAGRILAHNYRSIQEARKMEKALRQLETNVFNEEDNLTTDKKDQQKITAIFDKALSICESNITEQGERSILKQIRKTWESVKPQFLQHQTKETIHIQFKKITLIYEDIEELLNTNEKAMFDYEKETRHVALLMRFGVGIAFILAIVALGLFALVSAHRISKPIVQVASRLHHALNPHLSEDAYADTDTDEIQLLREELDALLIRLAHYEDEQNKKLLHLQSRLAFVINEILEGLVLIDNRHQILAVNRVAKQILGQQNSEGKQLEDLVLREDIKRMMSPIMDNTFQPERDLGEIHFEVDGGERIYRPRVLTVAGRDDSIEGYLILFWDVTEQRRFEESRRRFISMLSHQLKTPMTSLSMSVNLLRERINETDSAQAELISIATENCNNLAGLISDLIEASREATPDLTIKPRRINLIRLLRAGLRPLIPQADEKKIKLVVPDENLSIFAKVDVVKFPWVITNIVGNALRYTDNGGRIIVSASIIDEMIEVSVSDNGIGISRDDQNYIFEPYVTIDNSPQRETHGLGLAIAKEIVEAHKGTIEVESDIGKGTTFRIQLPTQDSEVE